MKRNTLKRAEAVEARLILRGAVDQLDRKDLESLPFTLLGSLGFQLHKGELDAKSILEAVVAPYLWALHASRQPLDKRYSANPSLEEMDQLRAQCLETGKLLPKASYE